MIERGGPNPFIARRTPDDKQTVTSSSGTPLVNIRSDKDEAKCSQAAARVISGRE